MKPPIEYRPNAKRSTKRDVSTSGKPSSTAASQGKAVHVGTESETPANRVDHTAKGAAGKTRRKASAERAAPTPDAEAAIAKLTKLRLNKAAQMRRYRAKLKAKGVT